MRDFGDIIRQLRSWQADRVHGRNSLITAIGSETSPAAPVSQPARVRKSTSVARIKPDWISKLPPKMRGYLAEVYEAQRLDLRWLAAIGLRGVVEVLFIQLVGDLPTYAAKLEKLRSNNMI